jgi:hypothetical protein
VAGRRRLPPDRLRLCIDGTCVSTVSCADHRGTFSLRKLPSSGVIHEGFRFRNVLILCAMRVPSGQARRSRDQGTESYGCWVQAFPHQRGRSAEGTVIAADIAADRVRKTGADGVHRAYRGSRSLSMSCIPVCPYPGSRRAYCFLRSHFHTIKWLQVLGGTEPPHIDESVGHQFHPVVTLLDVLEPEEHPLEFVLPGKRPFHAIP